MNAETVTDCISNWTVRQNVTGMTCRCICWSPELKTFCAISDETSNGKNVQLSAEGIGWKAFVGGPGQSWQSVCWAKERGLLVAVAVDGTNRAMTSPDGKIWTLRPTPALYLYLSVIWIAELGIFVAVAALANGNGVMTSTDGITWTARTAPGGNAYWCALAWSPLLGLLVAVAQSGEIMTSQDGFSWTLQAAPNRIWTAAAWSPLLKLYVVVGANGSIMTSTNGLTWILRTSPTTNQHEGVAWSPELRQFAVVADTGTGDRIITSPDGITWIPQANPIDNAYAAIAWSPDAGVFAVVADRRLGDISTERCMTSKPPDYRRVANFLETNWT